MRSGITDWCNCCLFGNFFGVWTVAEMMIDEIQHIIM